MPLVSANGCRTLAKFRKRPLPNTPLLGSCPHETKHSGRGYEIIIKEIRPIRFPTLPKFQLAHLGVLVCDTAGICKWM